MPHVTGLANASVGGTATARLQQTDTVGSAGEVTSSWSVQWVAVDGQPAVIDSLADAFSAPAPPQPALRWGHRPGRRVSTRHRARMRERENDGQLTLPLRDSIYWSALDDWLHDARLIHWCDRPPCGYRENNERNTRSCMVHRGYLRDHLERVHHICADCEQPLTDAYTCDACDARRSERHEE